MIDYKWPNGPYNRVEDIAAIIYLCLPQRLMDNSLNFKTTAIDKSIEELKQLRDNKLHALLRTPDLMIFLEEHYNTFAISPVKLEFLKRDLKTLLQSPLDLVHYSSLLRQVKEANPEAKDSFVLIEQEVKSLIEKYGFEKLKPY